MHRVRSALRVALSNGVYWIAVMASTLFNGLAIAQPLVLQGVNTNDFRITTFASGLNFPLGMTRLADDSLLVTVAEGGNIFATSGDIVRFTDTNQDGIADDSGEVVYSGLSGCQTALHIAGTLILVTGQGTPISILRMGAKPSSPLTLLGELILTYPGSWEHEHSELELRQTPGFTNRYDLFFQVGSEFNFDPTTNTVALTNENVLGASGVLSGDSIYMITLIDDGATISATNLTRVASGVRNPAGFAFQMATGDFYFTDNGIDGLVDPTEPLSADELDFIARTNLGVTTPFFGFPTNYTEYRTGNLIGGAGVQPLIAFEPQPDPFTGAESEGPNQTIFAPPGFPDGINTGLFIGFHGQFNYAGTNNEENPVVYADPATGSYFHFILGQQPGIGHLDGLLATRDSLFVADFVSTGDVNNGAGAGVIYQIKSLIAPTPPDLIWQRSGTHSALSWDRGKLFASDNVNGPWNVVTNALSPFTIEPEAPTKFYRSGY